MKIVLLLLACSIVLGAAPGEDQLQIRNLAQKGRRVRIKRIKKNVEVAPGDDDDEYNPDIGGMSPASEEDDAADESKPGPKDAADRPFVIKGAKKVLKVDCKDRNVSVVGNANKIVLTGACRLVSVTGADNEITLDVVEMITVDGTKNRIGFAGGPDGKQPRIAANGKGNVVKKVEGQTSK